MVFEQSWHVAGRRGHALVCTVSIARSIRTSHPSWGHTTGTHGQADLRCASSSDFLPVHGHVCVPAAPPGHCCFAPASPEVGALACSHRTGMAEMRFSTIRFLLAEATDETFALQFGHVIGLLSAFS